MTKGPKIQNTQDQNNELYCFEPDIRLNLHLVNSGIPMFQAVSSFTNNGLSAH